MAPTILGRHDDDDDDEHRANFLTLIGSSGEGPRLPISHLLRKLHFRGGKMHFPPFVFVRSMCTFSCTFLCHLILMQTSMLIYSNNNRTHSSSRTSERDSSRSSSSCSSHYTVHASSFTKPVSYSLHLPSPRFVSLCRALCVAARGTSAFHPSVA